MLPTPVLLVLGLAFGAFAYQQAVGYERRTGRRAWNLPHIVWAVLTGMSLVVGAILFYFATKDSPRDVRPAKP